MIPAAGIDGGPEPIAIIAGNGRLPHAVAAAARRSGYSPFIVQLKGEKNAADWSDFPHIEASIGGFAPVVATLKARNIRKVVLSGGVTARPDPLAMRPTLKLLASLPRIFKLLKSGGDDAVLRMVIGLFEREGFEIVGAQEIAGDLVAVTGQLGKIAPGKTGMVDVQVAARAACEIGRLDIGQGAVSVGGRVVALEGAEGTDQMLSRIGWMREAGRISRSRPGVLVKLCKPQQDERADLPSIGPDTVSRAASVGLNGIAIEAGRALILDRAETVALADEAGIFIYVLDSAAGAFNG